MSYDKRVIIFKISTPKLTFVVGTFSQQKNKVDQSNLTQTFLKAWTSKIDGNSISIIDVASYMQFSNI